MSDTKGGNDKNSEQRFTHLGNPIKKELADHVWKPGQSGNPRGIRKRKLNFLDYLKQYFDEEVQSPRDSGPKMIPRLQYLAWMIGTAAMRNTGDPNLRRDCIRIVVDALMPEEKKTKVAFLPVIVDPGSTAAGFLDSVRHAAGSEQVTPELVMDMLEADAQGRLPVIDVEAEDGNGQDAT